MYETSEVARKEDGIDDELTYAVVHQLFYNSPRARSRHR